jgi:hypothetical protein
LKRWPHAEQDHRTRCFNKGAAEQWRTPRTKPRRDVMTSFGCSARSAIYCRAGSPLILRRVFTLQHHHSPTLGWQRLELFITHLSIGYCFIFNLPHSRSDFQYNSV